MKTNFKAMILSMAILSASLQLKAQINWRSPMLAPTRPIVIIKADDYAEGAETEWQTFFDLIENEDICASVGIITNRLGNASRPVVQNQNAVLYLNDIGDYTKQFEFWNHSNNHDDFLSMTETEQKNDLTSAQNIFVNSLGFESHAFGAPGNRINQDTKYALDNYNDENNDQLKIWMSYASHFSPISDLTGWNKLFSRTYDGTDYSHMRYEIAYSDDHGSYFDPVPSEVISNWNALPDISFFLIELHPASYNSTKVAQLVEIINFMKEQNALFVTPSYLYTKATTERYCGDYYNTSTIAATTSLSAGSSVSDQCIHTIVHSGANVTFTASKSISLRPGFHSQSGAAFKASIAPSAGQSGRMAATPSVKVVTSERQIAAYPNPNNGVFVIEFSDARLNNSSVVVTDLNGKVIKTLNSTLSRETIDLSTQPAGLYVIRVLSGEKQSIYKILKR